METNEFTKQLTDMGYGAYRTEHKVCVTKDDIGIIAEVLRRVRYGMSIIPRAYRFSPSEWSEVISEEVVDLIVEYASTPTDER